MPSITPNHILLHLLGRHGPHHAMRRALQSGEAGGVLRTTSHDTAPAQNWVGKGLQCTLQRTVPDAPGGQPHWGLHSVCLLTSAMAGPMAWSGPWPSALPAERSTMHDAVAAFGPPLSEEGGMALFEAAMDSGIDCAVHCQFSERGQLQTLSLIRLGEWQSLQGWASENDEAGTPSPDAAAELAAPMAADLRSITCASAGIAPRTGWYEAKLPAHHPSQGYYSTSQGRFARVHEGHRMLSLGVVPQADEALVVWTWLRED